MRVEPEPGSVDRYGKGYHCVTVEVCPHCGRDTERRNLTFAQMGAKSRVCPWCSRNIVSRLISRAVRGAVAWWRDR